LLFPKKLWKMVESDQFMFIWWSKGGKCIAINEDLFKQEVLGRAGPLCAFATERTMSFIQQLNLYGFIKMQRDFQRSASLPEFLAEEAAASAHSKLFYYYNPNFNREHPHLLERCKRRVGLQQRAPAASGQDAEMDEKQPSQSPHG
ncbi:Heat shock transcription factor, Y-linked, partial [Cathartes aura]